ncbi:MAG: AMP-dependent synthetase/ligase [Acidobacteriota bacterium]
MTRTTSFTDLVDVLQKSTDRFANNRLFGTKIDGRWQWITYGDFGRRVDAVRAGLARLGVQPGDTVAVIAANRVEWALGAYATYGLGARYCPMYESQHDDDRKYILEDSGAKVVIASTYAIYETCRGWIGQVGQLETAICCALPPEDENSFAYVEAQGAAHPTPVVASIDPESVCGFIYTSGTTGKPKGVLLSHRNIVSNLNGVADILPVGDGDVSVSFLPWAHSFGQTCELHLLLSNGATLALAESVEKLVDNFGEVRPTVLFSVPRVFNKIYDGVQKKMVAAGGLKQRLFNAALANAGRRKALAREGRSSFIIELRHKVYDKLVFSKVRERFGGRLRFAVSGGAALSTEVGDFIDSLGIMVCEGYGLTETSPICTTNHPKARKMGSVGQPIQAVEVIIDTSVVDNPDSVDGEIVIKGPNVMMGYHGLEEATKEVMRDDGAFRTGDLGRLDDEGFLYITGRIKEQYKLENGKYVVPAPLEEQLQLSGYISQACIHGFNKPYNVALIVPDRVALESWAKENGLDVGNYDALMGNEQVRAMIQRELEANQGNFKGYERIRKFHLIPEEFSVDNGMLTPKMSLKRKIVMDRYVSEFEALHA